MLVLNEFLSWDNLARGSDMTLTMPTNGGFFPFGPDKGDAGPFTVAVEILNHGAIGDSPWRFFQPKIRIYNTGTYPSYSVPTGLNEGPITFGTVGGCRFPPDYFRPIVYYADYQTQTENGSIKHVNQGYQGDSYATQVTFLGNEGKAAAVIAYLTGTARASDFPLTVPDWTYPFGRDVTTNYMNVKLINGSIDMTHVLTDMWSFDLQMTFVKDIS
jgi:hypothetical protein